MRETNVQMPVVGNPADLSLRDIVIPLFRRKRILITTFLCVLAGIPLLALVRGPAYSSRMVILVNQERMDPLVSTEATTQVVTTQNPVTAEEINSEVELLSSRDVLEQVVIANGLENPRGFSLMNFLRPWQTRDDRIARAVKGLAKQLKIDNIKNSNLIEVVFQSPDPQVSHGVLKSLGDLYVAKHVAVHRPAGSYEFFAQETQKYHDELSSAEAKLRNFSRQNAIAAPDEQRRELALKTADFVGQLHATEQGIAGDEERIKSDQQQLGAIPERATTLKSSAPNDKLVSDASATLLAAQARRTALALKYDDSYPLVQEADQEIAQARAAVASAQTVRSLSESTDRDPTHELLREDMAKTRADLSGERATLAATRRSIQSLQNQMVNLDQLSLTQQDLQRDAKADESNYLLYLAKREQERTTNALDATRIANVAIAVPPAIPVLPVLSWPMTTLIALVLAFVLSIGVAYAVDYFDPSFHTPGQVVDMLGIPIVVGVPRKSA